MSDTELEAMLARAAEEGARRALSDVGLGGKDAELTIHACARCSNASRSYAEPPVLIARIAM